MTVLNETVGMSIILPVAQCDLRLTAWEKGIIGGSIYLGAGAEMFTSGMMFSSYFWGYLADTRGRQLVLKYALFATSFFGAISCLATGFVSLLVLRFLTGFCVAAQASTVYAYLGEFTTPSRRSQMLSFASVWGSVGIVYIPLVSWWILSYDWAFVITDSFEFKPWRLLFIINTLPALLNGIAFCFCPESPKFLVSQGRNEEALEVLKMVGTDTADGYEVQKLRLDPEDAIAREQNGDKSGGLLKSMIQQTIPIVKLPYLVYFIICCVHNIGAFAIYGGLGLWFPDIMNHIFLNTSSMEGTTICTILQQNGSQAIGMELCDDEMETFLYAAISGVISIVQGLVLSIIVGKINPKIMIIFNFTFAGSCGVALQYISNPYAETVLFCLEIVFTGYCVVLCHGYCFDERVWTIKWISSDGCDGTFNDCEL
uniref:Major facilitator superfamily (MFS) profile domain-containing protein n=1 Tax=Anopheles dirus TaxID=7168 RepID=A0A182N5S6_9DIPT